MGLSSKKSSSKTNQQTSMTTTPTNPAFVTQGIEGLAGKIGDTFKSLDPYSLVAGPDPLQTQAAGLAAGLQQTGRGFGQAADIYKGLAGGGGSILDHLGDYMSPYTKDVVDTSLADYDFGAGQTRAQNQLALAGDTTFGGSGGAIQTALSEDAINRGRGSLSAGLRDQAFNTGAGLASSDMERQLQAKLAAASGLTQNAQVRGSEDRANIGAQADIGEMLRQIEAARKLAPVTALGAESSLFSGLPLDLLHGTKQEGTLNSTTKSKQSGGGLTDWLNFFAANAQAAAKMGG